MNHSPNSGPGHCHKWRIRDWAHAGPEGQVAQIPVSPTVTWTPHAARTLEVGARCGPPRAEKGRGRLVQASAGYIGVSRWGGLTGQRVGCGPAGAIDAVWAQERMPSWTVARLVESAKCRMGRLGTRGPGGGHKVGRSSSHVRARRHLVPQRQRTSEWTRWPSQPLSLAGTVHWPRAREEQPGWWQS